MSLLDQLEQVALLDSRLRDDQLVHAGVIEQAAEIRRADRPVLTSNVQRTVTVRGACGVPATAKQVLVKVTALSASGKGNLRFYPGAVTATPSGILRFERGATRTETFTLPLSANGTLTILPLVAGKGTVHVAVEVNGYSQ